MKTRLSIPRAAVSALLVLMVVGTALVPPFLDKDDGVRITLESAHDPSNCPNTHDHRVCAQIDVTRGILTPQVAQAVPLATHRATEHAERTVTRSSGAVHLPPSRGPPA